MVYKGLTTVSEMGLVARIVQTGLLHLFEMVALRGGDFRAELRYSREKLPQVLIFINAPSIFV